MKTKKFSRRSSLAEIAMRKNYTRTADEDIYASMAYDQPKEAFKQIAALLKLGARKNRMTEKSLLDIGSAAGAFLHYVRTINPVSTLHGVEYSRKLVEGSAPFLKTRGITVSVGDAEKLGLPDRRYDFVVSSGVTSIFDDFRPSFSEMIRVAKPGAVCLNLMLLNPFPVDVIMRYVHPKTGALESGWNKFSMRSVGEFLKRHPRVKRFRFVKHVMPFDIKKTDDPMRSWTLKDTHGKRILWNGLGMEITLYHVVFEIKK